MLYYKKRKMTKTIYFGKTENVPADNSGNAETKLRNEESVLFTVFGSNIVVEGIYFFIVCVGVGGEKQIVLSVVVFNIALG